MSVRASVIASLFFVSSVASSCATAFADGAISLDFTPLGAHAASSARTSAAPADVNFGSYPLSVLGIENAIHGAESRLDEYARGERRCDDGPIAYSVVAIRDWEKHYPNDPWIAKDLLALARFYAHVGTHDARSDERGVAEWLVHDYPSTAYASNANTLLAELGTPVPHAEYPTVAAKRAIRETTAVARVRSATPSVALKSVNESSELQRPAVERPQTATVPVAQPPADAAPANPQSYATYAVRRRPTTAPTLPPYAHYETSPTDSASSGGGSR